MMQIYKVQSGRNYKSGPEIRNIQGRGETYEFDRSQESVSCFFDFSSVSGLGCVSFVEALTDTSVSQEADTVEFEGQCGC